MRPELPPLTEEESHEGTKNTFMDCKNIWIEYLAKYDKTSKYEVSVCINILIELLAYLQKKSRIVDDYFFLTLMFDRLKKNLLNKDIVIDFETANWE